MKIYRSIAELSILPGPVALAIGVFDGVHLGHQEVIQAARDYAVQHRGSAVVMTFDPHPARVLRPDLAPLLLCSTRHKLRILERLGLEHALVCEFTESMSQMDPEAFISSLVQAARPLGFVSVGYTWSFGRSKAGNIHRLMEFGQHHGFGVYGVPEVKHHGAVVSSTAIRAAVRRGDLATAKNLLGRDYTVLGEVIPGQQLARKLGFPTANLALESEEIPPNGVYAVRVLLDGSWEDGVANLGTRPTVNGTGRLLEVHLLNTSGDYYGKLLEVAFISRLREEQKFPSLEALQAQIALDLAAARRVLD